MKTLTKNSGFTPFETARLQRAWFRTGFSAIEVVFGVSIIAFVFLGLTASFNLQLRSIAGDERSVQAGFLAEEGLEAMRSVRDAGWVANIKNLSTTTPYYLVWSNTNRRWSTTTMATTTDSIFFRTVRLADVFRNASDQIVSSGGTYDKDARLVTVTVAWPDRQGTSTRSFSSYLNNANND